MRLCWMCGAAAGLTLTGSGGSLLAHAVPEPRVDLRKQASFIANMDTQLSQLSLSAAGLLRRLTDQVNFVEQNLVQQKRRRQQLMFQCHDPANSAFSDVRTQPTLSQGFKLWDPLAAAKWRRGYHIASRHYGAQSIIQDADWNATSMGGATMLLTRFGMWTLGSMETRVALRPLSDATSKAGIVFGYKNPQSYLFGLLTMNPDDTGLVEFGKVDNQGPTVLNSWPVALTMDPYHVFEIFNGGTQITFKLDYRTVGQTRLDYGLYDAGNVGITSVTGPMEFYGFTIGPEQLKVEPPDSAKEVDQYFKDLKDAKSSDTPISLLANATDEIKKQADACTIFAPKHIMPGDLICNDATFWKQREQLTHSSSLSSLRTIHSSDDTQSCVVKDWACRDAKIEMRVRLQADGSAGAIFRYHNASSYHTVEVESLTQKVMIHRQDDNGGLKLIHTLLSTVPILLHETNKLTVIDNLGKVTVKIDDQDVITEADISYGGGSVPKSGGGGFLVRRGAVIIEDLLFGPLMGNR